MNNKTNEVKIIMEIMNVKMNNEWGYCLFFFGRKERKVNNVKVDKQNTPVA